MTGAELKELAAKAQAAYDTMTPLQKMQHDLAQRRSFMRGSCPSARNYDEWCGHVDETLKADPAFVLLAEVERLRALGASYAKRIEMVYGCLTPEQYPGPPTGLVAEMRAAFQQSALPETK